MISQMRVVGGSIKDDPVVKKIMARLSDSERESFSDDQLHSLKTAFAAMEWDTHPVDLRWTLKGLRKSYYFVFLAGAEVDPSNGTVI
jgi:hypothetical protein